MPSVVNTQKEIEIELAAVRSFCRKAARAVAESGGHDFCVAFVTDAQMQQLNHTFRGKNSTTDVLSFPLNDVHAEAEAPTPNGGLLGDIVISAETARRQASENGLTLENEIKQLILHGLLHLCGYDHETDGGEMEARELELRIRLDI